MRNCVVEGQRPVDICAGDLTAPPHQRQAGRIEGRGDAGCHRLDRRKDRDARFGHTEHVKQIDGILANLALGGEIGGNIDGRIGNPDQPVMPWNIDYEDVTAPTIRQT